MRNDTSGDEPIVFRFLDIFHVVHLFSEIPNPSLKRISSNFKLSRGGIRRLKSWWFAKRNINYYFWRRISVVVEKNEYLNAPQFSVFRLFERLKGIPPELSRNYEAKQKAAPFEKSPAGHRWDSRKIRLSLPARNRYLLDYTWRIPFELKKTIST